MNRPAKPRISVLIEGYNDSLDLGSALETFESIAAQDYPLADVEIILTGSEAQAATWKQALQKETRFFAVQVIGTEAHYYRLKNLAAEAARGDILVFTDSDVKVERGWLAAIDRGISSGADATAGLTLFRQEGGARRSAWLLPAAASISWGFIVDDPEKPARGFLSHNLAFRRAAFEQIRYREDLGRTCAGSFLYDALKKSGLKLRFQPEQRVRHIFHWRWWLTRLHVRFGYEVFLLRRIQAENRHGWTQRLSVLEPLATMLWHVALDVPQWFRFSKCLGWTLPRRLAYVPGVCAVSLAARSCEAAGMYSTMIDQERMRRFALSN